MDVPDLIFSFSHSLILPLLHLPPVIMSCHTYALYEIVKRWKQREKSLLIGRGMIVNKYVEYME